MTDDRPSNASGSSVLGRATTFGQSLPLGIDDPVIAARAVRRALAAAGRHAADVDTMVVATTDPVSADGLAAFARRALGPHGSSVRTVGLVVDAVDATSLVAAAARIAASSDAARQTRTAVTIALGVGRDGTAEAWCMRPS